jgi:chitinase
MIAIGGWNDTAGFSAGAADNTTRARYAKNVAAMLDSVGADGVGMERSFLHLPPCLSRISRMRIMIWLSKTDIDWEYPGVDGQDDKQIPILDKVSEITAFPLLLQGIREAIGKDKLLSVAVPGLKGDMIAYTSEQGPNIWPSVDFVNAMTYDLMNRRSSVTKHHTSVRESLETVNNYITIGLDPAKLNLGFAYYAKYFTTDPRSDCATHPIGCRVVPSVNLDGSDNGKSGDFTFETGNMSPPPPNLHTSTDGSCGFAKATKCPDGQCCSPWEHWWVKTF